MNRIEWPYEQFMVQARIVFVLVFVNARETYKVAVNKTKVCLIEYRQKSFDTINCSSLSFIKLNVCVCKYEHVMNTI